MWKLVSQLIDGTFPDYQQIIPRSYKSRTLVSTASLLKACKQAEIFAREGSNVARLDIKQSSGDMQPSEVEISATSEETGKNETIVEATVDGGGVLIAFNVKFLREVLEVIKTPNVALETSGANAPVSSARWVTTTSCTSSCPCTWDDENKLTNPSPLNRNVWRIFVIPRPYLNRKVRQARQEKR